jgi:hypothetical protein
MPRKPTQPARTTRQHDDQTKLAPGAAVQRQAEQIAHRAGLTDAAHPAIAALAGLLAAYPGLQPQPAPPAAQQKPRQKARTSAVKASARSAPVIADRATLGETDSEQARQLVELAQAHQRQSTAAASVQSQRAAIERFMDSL